VPEAAYPFLALQNGDVLTGLRYRRGVREQRFWRVRIASSRSTANGDASEALRVDGLPPAPNGAPVPIIEKV